VISSLSLAVIFKENHKTSSWSEIIHLFDQQRDVIIDFGLDIFCLFEIIVPEFDVVYASTGTFLCPIRKAPASNR
jgi:hypothetical protein